jgi:chromate transporter
MPSALEILGVYLKIGSFSFGSATSQVILDEVVEKKRWLSIERFRDAHALAALIPGPFHVNLAGMTGYAVGGLAGSLVAVAAFVLPGFLLAAALALTLHASRVIALLQANPGITAGMLLAAAGLLLNVIVQMGRRTLPSASYWAWVLAAVVLVTRLHVHYAVLVLGAGLLFSLHAHRARARQS